MSETLSDTEADHIVSNYWEAIRCGNEEQRKRALRLMVQSIHCQARHEGVNQGFKDATKVACEVIRGPDRHTAQEAGGASTH